MQNFSKNGCLLKRAEEQEFVARKFGFYWDHINQLIAQIQNECLEIQEAWQKNDSSHLQEEIGDLLLAAISLSVFCNLDPHDTLYSKASKNFKKDTIWWSN